MSVRSGSSARVSFPREISSDRERTDDQLLDVEVLHGVGGGGLLSLIEIETNLSVSVRSLFDPSYRRIVHRIRPCSRLIIQGFPGKGLTDRFSAGISVGNTPVSIQLDRLRLEVLSPSSFITHVLTSPLPASPLL
jgi:hypothetical protein